MGIAESSAMLVKETCHGSKSMGRVSMVPGL